MSAPGQFGVEFLDWLRTATERAWAELTDWSLADFERAGMLGSRWRPGTRWTGGLAAVEIAAVERAYGVEFPAPQRLFLAHLHSTTPAQRTADYARYGDRLALRDTPGFYDWRQDEAAVRERLALAPDSRAAVAELARGRGEPPAALLPIFGHRYVVAAPQPWVVSVVDTDAVVYGEDLRDYLLRELVGLLGTG